VVIRQKLVTFWKVGGATMTGLEITDCRVRPCVKEDEKLKAFATITLNNCFVVTDLKVIYGNKGLFVAMPSRRRKDGKFRDIAHPLNSETRAMIEKIVLDLYQKELERFGGKLPVYSEAEDALNDFGEE
jgi:stage V sporulation protein G